MKFSILTVFLALVAPLEAAKGAKKSNDPEIEISPGSSPAVFPTPKTSSVEAPTDAPSDMPSDAPSDAPSEMPSDVPTMAPTCVKSKGKSGGKGGKGSKGESDDIDSFDISGGKAEGKGKKAKRSLSGKGGGKSGGKAEKTDYDECSDDRSEFDSLENFNPANSGTSSHGTAVIATAGAIVALGLF